MKAYFYRCGRVFAVAIGVPALSMGVWAQSSELTQRISTDRQMIASQRSAAESAFQHDKTVCDSKFAVFDCLREARSKRRGVLDELRRQDLLLNDMERQAKGMDALQRIQENTSEQRQQQALQQEQQALQAQRERQIRFDEKQTLPRDPVPQSAVMPKDSSNPDSLLESQRYQDKLQQARQHKLEKEKALSGSKNSKQLPVPPGP